MSHNQTLQKSNPSAHRFMFATGIENNYPIIELPHGSIKRVDEMSEAQASGDTV